MSFCAKALCQELRVHTTNPFNGRIPEADYRLVCLHLVASCTIQRLPGTTRTPCVTGFAARTATRRFADGGANECDVLVVHHSSHTQAGLPPPSGGADLREAAEGANSIRVQAVVIGLAICLGTRLHGGSSAAIDVTNSCKTPERHRLYENQE